MKSKTYNVMYELEHDFFTKLCLDGNVIEKKHTVEIEIDFDQQVGLITKGVGYINNDGEFSVNISGFFYLCKYGSFYIGEFDHIPTPNEVHQRFIEKLTFKYKEAVEKRKKEQEEATKAAYEKEQVERERKRKEESDKNIDSLLYAKHGGQKFEFIIHYTCEFVNHHFYATGEVINNPEKYSFWIPVSILKIMVSCGEAYIGDGKVKLIENTIYGFNERPNYEGFHKFLIFKCAETKHKKEIERLKIQIGLLEGQLDIDMDSEE